MATSLLTTRSRLRGGGGATPRGRIKARVSNSADYFTLHLQRANLIDFTIGISASMLSEFINPCLLIEGWNPMCGVCNVI